MVRGAFCGTPKSDLVFIPGKAKVDPVLYMQRFMEPQLAQFRYIACEAYECVGIVEDGASGHKGAARQYWKLNEMKSIKWPAQSPDLNLQVMEAQWLDMKSGLGETGGRIGNIPAVEQTLNMI